MLADRERSLGKICWKCKERPAVTEIDGKPLCEECAGKKPKNVGLRSIITPQQKEFLGKLVTNGIFMSEAEAIRAGINMLRKEYSEFIKD